MAAINRVVDGNTPIIKTDTAPPDSPCVKYSEYDIFPKKSVTREVQVTNKMPAIVAITNGTAALIS